MSPKDLVTRFFEDGYTHKNFQSVMNCVASDYVDHSPAGARSNTDAVNILKIVAGQFSDLKVTMLDVFSEGPMVSTRVLYEGIHTGALHGSSGYRKGCPLRGSGKFSCGKRKNTGILGLLAGY